MRPIKLLETINPVATSLLVNEKASLKEIQDYLGKVAETLRNLGFVTKENFRVDCEVGSDEWVAIRFYADPYDKDGIELINFLSFFYLDKKIDGHFLLTSVPEEVRQLREDTKFADLEQIIYATIRNMPDRFID